MVQTNQIRFSELADQYLPTLPLIESNSVPETVPITDQVPSIPLAKQNTRTTKRK